MDTEFARTFLAIATGGSFVAAAERLNVTQSTVSARIRTLEEQLGASLFVRNRSGATMTAAGRRFHRHASFLVRAVERARHDVGLPAGYAESVVIAARIGLWDGFMDGWLTDLRRDLPEVALRAEIGMEPEIMHGLVEGRVDLGVMYTPERRPTLEMQALLEERMVLVASATAPGEAKPDYIHVDWGPEFAAQYEHLNRGGLGPGLSVNIGWLGLRYLLENGGSGYFPERIVDGLIEEGRVVRVPDAPVFALPAFVVHARDAGPTIRDLCGRLLQKASRFKRDERTAPA